MKFNNISFFLLLKQMQRPRDKNFVKKVYCINLPIHGLLLPLVFETFLKLDKLQCKSSFNRNEVLLLMIDNFETNQIVLYFQGGYMMDLETTCHVSRVTCQM